MVRRKVAGMLIVLMSASLGNPVGTSQERVSLDPTDGLSAFQITYLDAAGYREKAISNGRLEISALGKTYNFSLAPVMDDMAPGARILDVDQQGNTIELPISATLFRGTVPGEKITGIFSLNGAWVRGLIDDGENSIYVEPRNPQGGQGLVETVIYSDEAQAPIPPPDGGHPADLAVKAQLNPKASPEEPPVPVVGVAPMAGPGSSREPGNVNAVASSSPEQPNRDNASAEQFVWFERPGRGVQRAKAAEVEYDPGNELRIRPQPPAPQRTLVSLLWLDREFESVGGTAPFSVTQRPDGEYAVLDHGPTSSNREEAFVRIAVGSSPLYTLGSSDSIRLQARAMVVDVQQTPGWIESEETLVTPNGTITQPRLEYQPRLAIDFQAQNHTGQRILYNKHWLGGFDIWRPVFHYDNGMRLSFTETPTHFVVDAPHFTTIYTFDASNEGFVVEADRTYSVIRWLSSSGYVEINSDNRDTQDEFFTRTLGSQWTSGTSFTVTSKWKPTQRGSWQGAMPLFLAATGATDFWDHANVLGFYYGSKDSSSSTVDYHMVYRDGSGVQRLNRQVSLTPNTEYHFYINYDSASRVLTMKIRDAADADVVTPSTYTVGSNAGDGFTLEKIGMSSYGYGGGGNLQTIGWVDDVSITTGSGGGGTLFSDSFDSGSLSQWQVVSGTWGAEGPTGAKFLSGTAGESEAWIYETTATALARPFTVDLDVVFAEDPTTSVSMHGGLMLATTAESRHTARGYTVDWLDVTGQYRVRRYDAPGETSLGTFAPAQAVQAGTTYHWKIEFTASAVTLTVTGPGGMQTFPSVSDSMYASALRLGLWAYNANHIHFDNVVITGSSPPNNPPSACFSVSPSSGTTSTVFSMDASCSTDDQTPVGSLQVRWDWENDGVYDTGWSTTKTASKQYSSAGTKTIKAEVKDGVGATSTTTRSVTVSNPNTAPSLSWTGESGYTVDGVNPDSGDYTTTFTYRAKYTDPDGTSPSYVRVHIDGDAGHAMTYASGSITTGAIYSYSTTLGPNTHTYHFEASDGSATARLPTGSGEMSGPSRTPPTSLQLFDAEWSFMTQTPNGVPWYDWIVSTFAFSDDLWSQVGVDAVFYGAFGHNNDIVTHRSCTNVPTPATDYKTWLSGGFTVTGVNAYQLVTGIDMNEPDGCHGIATRTGSLNSADAASVIEGRDVSILDSYAPGNSRHSGLLSIHEFGHLHGSEHYLECRSDFFGLKSDCNIMHPTATFDNTGTWWTQGSKDDIRIYAWPRLN